MKKNLIIIGLVLFCGYTYISQPATPPKRPILNAISKAIKWLPWIVPFVLDEEQQYMDTVAERDYGSVPEPAEHAPDGFAVIDHGDNW